MGKRVSRAPSASLVSALLALVITRSSRADILVQGEAEKLDPKKLSALVTLEVGTTPERLLVTMSQGRVRVSVRTKAGEDRSGEFDLPSASSAEPERLIALYTGELWRSEPETTHPVPAEPPRIDDPLFKTPTLLAGFGGRVFSTRGTLFWGPQLGGSADVRSRLRVSLLGRFEQASAQDPLGDVQATAASGALSLGYRIVPTGPFTLTVGGGIEGGVLFGRGNGRGESSTTNATLSAIAPLEARWLPNGPLGLGLTLEPGLTIVGVVLQADGRRVLAASGAFLGLRLSLVVQP
jgi:hypothetical protein